MNKFFVILFDNFFPVNHFKNWKELVSLCMRLGWHKKQKSKMIKIDWTSCFFKCFAFCNIMMSKHSFNLAVVINCFLGQEFISNKSIRSLNCSIYVNINGFLFSSLFCYRRLESDRTILWGFNRLVVVSQSECLFIAFPSIKPRLAVLCA